MSKRNERIGIRVSPNEYAKIVYNAKKSRFNSISSYVRHAAINQEIHVIDMSNLLKMSEELHR